MDQERADDKSCEATFHLFSWHKNNEEGLGLDDGMEDNIDVVKKLQPHPWIHYSWSDDE